MLENTPSKITAEGNPSGAFTCHPSSTPPLRASVASNVPTEKAILFKSGFPATKRASFTWPSDEKSVHQERPSDASTPPDAAVPFLGPAYPMICPDAPPGWLSENYCFRVASSPVVNPVPAANHWSTSKDRPSTPKPSGP